MAKVYCECKFKSNEYFGLYPPTLKNTIQFVHTCSKPTELVWRSTLKKCPECWGLFSSPWSEMCRDCWHECHPGIPFQGWSWATRIDQEFRKKLLDTRPTVCHTQGSGGSHAHLPGHLQTAAANKKTNQHH